MTTRASEEDRNPVFFHILGIVKGVTAIFRINDIIDLPLIDSLSAQRLCTIRDVILDMRENRVFALVCRERLFRRTLEAIPYRNVVSITQNGVGVAGITRQISLREMSMKHRRYQSYGAILGKLVLSSRGETLGVVRDLLFDTASGVIKAYELSEGYLDDFLHGRHIVGIDYENLLTGKNIILNDYSSNKQGHSRQ